MTVICIIRHGQTERNKAQIIQGRGDFELNEEGIRQAHVTGQYFKKQNEHFDVIGCSPLKRAKLTVSIVASELAYQNDIIILPNFIEREFGEADGKPIEPKIYEKIFSNEIKGMETSYEIQNRVKQAVIDLAHKYPNKRILVCSHSHAIKGLLTSLDKNRSFNDNLYNCAINYFSIDEQGNISIDKVNIKPE